MNVLFPFPKTSKCIKFYLQTDLIIIIVPKRRRATYSSKKQPPGVLKISQHSLENICIGVSF